jgi:hypothetical protein
LKYVYNFADRNWFEDRIVKIVVFKNALFLIKLLGF